MGRRNSDQPSDLDDLILNCLERQTCVTCRQIAQEINRIAQESGKKGWSESSFQHHLDNLRKRGKVKHQGSGFLIDRGWKEGQPKAFILVELATPKKRGENYQKKFVDEICEGFRRGEHEGLNLIGVDVVMGAEFSAIIQVYSDNLHFIGRFVKEYLLTSELVKMTRTLMVWPTELGSSRP